jgi:hypothetical protein
LWPESVIAEQPLQGSIDCIAVFLLTRVGTASWPAPDRSWRQCPFGFHRENSRAFCITRKGLICVKFFTIINNALYARETDVRTPTEQRRNWDAIARNAYCQEGSTKADAKLSRGVVQSAEGLNKMTMDEVLPASSSHGRTQRAKPAAGFNRRMRKTACPVVWEGHGAQSP